MVSFIDCLAKKAEEGRISKRTLDNILKTIDEQELRPDFAIYDTPEKKYSLEKLDRAYKILEHRLAQRVRQQEIHLDLVDQGKERFKKNVPIDVVLNSFTHPDEANSYRYGYLGPNATENIAANQRIFKGMATEILDGLDPVNVLKNGGEEYEKDIVRDLYAASRGVGERSKNPEVQKIVDRMIDFTTKGGQAFERAGGNITLRRDYFLGRNVNTEKILKAGKDNFVRDSVQAYDLDMVREATAGTISTVQELTAAAEKDYNAITSGGISDLSEYAPPGMKSVVNSRNHHRIFSFKDAESDMLWHSKYGVGNLYVRVVDYANSIGKDIGILQTYGPKPEAFLRAMLKEAAAIDSYKAGRLQDRTYRHFRSATGQWDRSLDPTISKLTLEYQRSQSASLLGGVFKDIMTSDLALGAVARKLRGMPALKGYLRTMKRFGTPGLEADQREWARLGWYTDAFIDDTYSMLVAREEGNLSSWNEWFARKNLQLSGATRGTHATKGESVRMLAELLTDDAFINSNSGFKDWLSINGIDDNMRNLIRKYGREKVQGWNLEVASPLQLYESGYKREAANLGTIFNTMSEMVSPTTSARLRGYWAERERGSKLAQLGVASMKGFTGYVGSLWDRNFKPALYQRGAANKAKWISSYASVLTTMGVLRTLIDDMLSGKDPKLDTSTVLRGLARSNILLMLGDPLLSGSQNDKSIFDKSIGVLGGHAGIGVSAVKNLVSGEWDKAGKRSQEFLERFVPFKNLWYTTLIQNRMIWDQLNKTYDADARKKFKQRADRSYKSGSPFWWEPGEWAPKRGIKLENITEQPFIRPEKRKKK